MNRITEAQLRAIVANINQATSSPVEPYRKTEKGSASNVGNYHLSFAYGGVSLHRMVNESGGVNDVFRCGHVPKRELANRMWAFLEGLQSKN